MGDRGQGLKTIRLCLTAEMTDVLAAIRDDEKLHLHFFIRN
jgi:hypothetical protein